MRKIIFAINMTLDGYFDHTAVIADDELHEKAAELYRSMDVIIYGRIMYQLMEEYWPKAISDKSLSPGVLDFARTINNSKKIVVTKTLKNISWNTSIMRSIDIKEINAMKQQPGKDILLGGGAKVAKAFMDLRLIDEYRFIIQPIILGKGRRLFEDIDKRDDLILSGENVRKSGAVELIYQSRNRKYL